MNKTESVYVINSKIKKNERSYTAIHEAGHAIMAIHLNRELQGVSIYDSPFKGKLGGSGSDDEIIKCCMRNDPINLKFRVRFNEALISIAGIESCIIAGQNRKIALLGGSVDTEELDILKIAYTRGLKRRARVILNKYLVWIYKTATWLYNVNYPMSEFDIKDLRYKSWRDVLTEIDKFMKFINFSK